MINLTSAYKNLQAGLQIPEGDLVVFTGLNNTGKSNILRFLSHASPIKDEIDYISPNRLNIDNYVSLQHTAKQETKNEFSNRKQFNEDQSESNSPSATRELINLSDANRARVIEWHNKYFGKLLVERNDPENEFSAPKILIDDKRPSSQGSGSRAVLTILVKLLDPSLSRIAIDEPELGVEPQIQKKLFKLIKKVSKGEDGLPKKQVYLATHSHLFLDKEEIGNNYVLTKDVNSNISINKITQESELHHLVFRLLGNSPDDLFFPRNIIIVEGPSDQIFLRKVIEILNYSGPLAIHFADGDGRIKFALPAIDNMLKTTSYLPLYRNRVCILVDSRVDPKQIKDWKDYLGNRAEERVLILPKNGIEHYYPKSILSNLTGLVEPDLSQKISEFNEQMSAHKEAGLGEFSGTKKDLATIVTAKMTPKHVSEIEECVKQLCKTACDLAD